MTDTTTIDIRTGTGTATETDTGEETMLITIMTGINTIKEKVLTAEIDTMTDLMTTTTETDTMIGMDTNIGIGITKKALTTDSTKETTTTTRIDIMTEMAGTETGLTSSFPTSLHLQQGVRNLASSRVLTPSLSISEDWSMLFWCLKAEKGGFTPALEE